MVFIPNHFQFVVHFLSSLYFNRFFFIHTHYQVCWNRISSKLQTQAPLLENCFKVILSIIIFYWPYLVKIWTDIVSLAMKQINRKYLCKQKWTWISYSYISNRATSAMYWYCWKSSPFVKIDSIYLRIFTYRCMIPFSLAANHPEVCRVGWCCFASWTFPDTHLRWWKFCTGIFPSCTQWHALGHLDSEKDEKYNIILISEILGEA